MEYFDIVFPQNVGPLTYRKPPGMKGPVEPGMMISAEIKKSVRMGIVYRPASAPTGRSTKDIIKAEPWPALGADMVKLLGWMADYYFSTEGSALKDMLPREFFDLSGQTSPVRDPQVHVNPDNAPTGQDPRWGWALEEIREQAGRQEYGSFLLHAPSTGFEFSFMLSAIKGLRGVIVLVPDHAAVGHIAGAMADAVGDRLAVYHGGLGRPQRREALRRIASGQADVVLGSRSAVFAPMGRVSLIAVLHEESPHYKSESGIRYNARDIAVMRGYLGGASVLLSSICPSVESYHNAEVGKYRLLDLSRAAEKPRTRVIDARRSKDAVSPRLRNMAEAAIAKGRRVLIYVNRLGYSMLQCPDCGHMQRCPTCDIPLVYHKRGRVLRCGYCGLESEAPKTCPVCGGHTMGPVGAGLERVEDELSGLHPVGVEGRRKQGLKVIMEGGGGLAVGTKALAGRDELGGGFQLVGVVNPDAYLHMPDFRAREKAFRDLCYAADRVSAGGELVIQSRHPGSPLMRYIRNSDYAGFYRDEVRHRRELLYPPFSKMVLLSTSARKAPETAKFRGVEVLGPVRSIGKRGGSLWKVLLKAGSRQDLRPAVLWFLRGGDGGKLLAEADPIAF